MRLKLRDIVTYVATPDGMLLRCGDTLLPVKGQQAFELFGRLQPLLNGSWSAEQLCSQLDDRKRKVVDTLLRALQAADMVYDASGDHPTTLDESLRQHYAPFLRRLEARSAESSRAFAEFRNTRLLIVGAAKMVFPLIEAGVEAGLSHQAFYVPDGNAGFEDKLQDVLSRWDLDHLKIKIERRQAPSSYKHWQILIDSFDVAIFAGDIHRDWEWMEAIAAAHTTAAKLSLLYAGSTILAGLVGEPSDRGCLHCIVNCYAKKADSLPGPEGARGELEISIAARLLMQMLLDARTDTLPANGATSLLEFNLRTFEITRRPWPIDWMCRACQEKKWVPESFQWPPTASDPVELASETYLSRIYDQWVDPVTGVIAHIEEGDLVQLPHHQSSALWRSPANHADLLWTNEIGANALVARVAVVRRALEEYLRQVVETLTVDRVLPVYSYDGKLLSNCTAGELQSGIVGSGKDARQLVADLFFRALACHANSLDGWIEEPLEIRLLDANAKLTAAYLDDIKALPGIKVERHRHMSVHGCAVLRFKYQDEPVSVVAGLADAGLWAPGIQDVWLHVTKVTAPLGAKMLPQTRYRCAEAPAASLWESMTTLSQALQLAFLLVPLSWRAMRVAGLPVFAYGCIANDALRSKIQLGTQQAIPENGGASDDLIPLVVSQ